jgi:phospholipid N-methyltransferase
MLQQNETSAAKSAALLKDWDSDDNRPYYELLPPETFRKIGVSAGLEDGPDIELVYADYIANTNIIIDACSSYGRVTKKILDKGYKGEIIVIERSNNFYSYLRNRFNRFAAQVQLAHIDIREFQTARKVDTVLCLWSSIAEFPKHKQLDILHQMSSWLKPDGVLILDTLLHTLRPKNALLFKDRNYMICTDYGVARGYMLSAEEIDAHATQLGYNVKRINYKTIEGIERILHVLYKKGDGAGVNTPSAEAEATTMTTTTATTTAMTTPTAPLTTPAAINTPPNTATTAPASTTTAPSPATISEKTAT